MNLTDFLSMETALRGLAIFAGGCAVTLLMRRGSAAARHHVLLCTMVAAAVIPWAAAVIPQWRVMPRWQPTLQAMAPIPEPVYAFSAEEDFIPPVTAARRNRPVDRSAEKSHPSPKNPASRPLSWKESAAVVWLGGTLLMLASSFGGMMMLRRLEKRAIRCEAGPLFDAVLTLSREMGLERRIGILLSRTDTMPMVWGIFRHRLLLPASAAMWPATKLRIVLLHELSHLRRNDPVALLTVRLALAFHWFNPLAWAAHHQLRAEQESACDDRVLSRGVTAPDYADEMLDFSTAFPKGPALVPAPMMLRGGGLEQRIRCILDTTRNRRPLSSRNAGNITLLATLLAVPLAVLGAADLIVKPAVRGRILDRNGIVLAETKGEGAARVHPFKALGVHLIGLSNPGNGGKGTAGVEESFEQELGTGRDVTLTLDARIQSVVESTLREAGIGRGAVVILDPANGDVLASASVPSFDPGNFSGVEEFRKLGGAETQPFLNRPFNAFAPGSTFSIVPALAASRAGREEARYECGFVKFGNHSVGCWLYNKSKDSHGEQNFGEAFGSGCGTYFNRLSVDVGFQEMSVTASLLGLGRPTGIRVPGEQGGQYGPTALPDGEKVSDVEACFVGMGQGNSAATPLQIASMAATIANGGRVFSPRMDSSVPASMTVELEKHGITRGRIHELQDGMVAYIKGPVGKRIRSEKVEIAGRTGTAQTVLRGKKSHNAWFTGYAPAEAPRYAIAVMIQEAGSGAGVAGPVARRILETITGELPPPVLQEPNEGHLRRLESEDVKL